MRQNKSPWIIGVTGGIGSGKSQVMQYLKNIHRFKIIKADLVAHEQMKPGTACYDQMIEVFGTGILQADQELDRKKLGQLVFADPVLLKRLNGIVHPAVKTAIKREIETGREYSYIAVEAALLIEDGYQSICDELWYIYADKETRIHRLSKSRGYSREKSIGIMNNQLEDAVFREQCQVIIDNSGAFEKTQKQIDQYLK